MATMKATQNGSTMHGGNGQASGKYVSGKVKGRKAESDKGKLDRQGHPPHFSANSKGANSLARAVSRWENEGGHLKDIDWKNKAKLVEDEDRILGCLGIALIKAWDDLPRDIQRDIFAAASEVEESGSSDERKEHIARFLHSYAN